MSYKHVGTAADLVRFGCSLKVECTACGAARTLTGIEVHGVHGSARIERLAARSAIGTPPPPARFEPRRETGKMECRVMGVTSKRVGLGIGYFSIALGL